MTNSGADGLKGSCRSIHYCQSRANLVLQAPFLQKQLPTDRTSAEYIFVNKEANGPYFYTQFLAGGKNRKDGIRVRLGSVRDL